MGLPAFISGPASFAIGGVVTAFSGVMSVFTLPFNLLWASPLGSLIRRLGGNGRPLALLQEWAENEMRSREKIESGTHWISYIVARDKKSKRDRRQDEELFLQARGRLREYAERIAPSSLYPYLYADVPEDLHKSIVVDGRLVNGQEPGKYLAGLSVDEKLVKAVWADATEFSARSVYISTVLGISIAFALATLHFNHFVPQKYKGTSEQVSLFKGAYERADIEKMSASTRAVAMNQMAEFIDVWSLSDFTSGWAANYSVTADAGKNSEKKNSDDGSVSYIEAGAFTLVYFGSQLILVALLSCFIAWNMFRFMHISRFTRLILDLSGRSVMPARMNWREGIVRWRLRAAEIVMHLEAYADQVYFATKIDRSPVFKLGRSLGLLDARGHLLGVEETKPICMSVVDMLQHIEVLGGSGEGKSRDFYIPLVKWLLDLRKQGYPIAIYATDDKGAIGADILAAAMEVGLPEDDVLCIGTGDNDYRVDLLDGLNPKEFGDILRSVVSQTGGASTDSFWDVSSADLAEQVAWVMKAYELTPEGVARAKQSGMRIYSIVNVFRYGTNDNLMREAITAVLNALSNVNGAYKYIQSEDSDALHSAYEFLIHNWMDMVDATKDGIRANLRKALRGFTSKKSLSDGFATGNSDRLIGSGELLSNKVKIMNISQIEHGFSGRLVSIMLKTIFFKLARAAEQRDPASAKRRLNWWFNPNTSLPTEEKDRYVINLFIADEYQGLVTAGGSDGLSDSTSWNVLRSAGIGGILLSQSVSAYRMAVGAEATENMRRNWRTKIFLRTEDLATIEEAKHLAGQTLRFYSHNPGSYESASAIRREHGYRVDQPSVIEFDSEDASSKGFMWMWIAQRDQMEDAFGWNFQTKYNLESIMEGRNIDEFDEDEEYKSSMSEQDEKIDYVPSEALQSQDIMEMGRGRAMLFVQRAGGTRVDVIKLNA